MDIKDYYFMDDPREAKRLSEKVDAETWVDTYLDSTIRDRTSILDVGCGPGVIASEVARRVPSAKVVAIDISQKRISEARSVFKDLPNATAELGSATVLPFPDASFDLVYSRFLLEYLSDRETAVSEMYRVCRPGGIVLLQDLDGQLMWHYPTDPGIQTALDAIIPSLEARGFDPFVGRKLHFLLRECGLESLKVRVDSYHLFAGTIDNKNLALWELKLSIALPAITAALGNLASAEAAKSRFLEYLKREDTLTYSVVFTVFGRKPNMF